MSYRDPLEAAHERIRALELEVKRLREHRREHQDKIVELQDATANARIAIMEGEAALHQAKLDTDVAVATATYERDAELATLRMELSMASQRAEAEREVLESKLELERVTNRARIDQLETDLRTLTEERDALREMSPAGAAEYYEARAAGMRSRLDTVDADLARQKQGAANAATDIERSVREQAIVRIRQMRDTLAAELAEAESLAARMHEKQR